MKRINKLLHSRKIVLGNIIKRGFPYYGRWLTMNFVGNIIWLLFGGIIAAIGWFIAGLILCVTIIGIPFGVQCFKIAKFVLWPFGKEIELGNFGVGGLLFNIIWLIVFGWEFAIGHLIIGAIFCITIVGIPFGMQHFKFAKIGLIPFGAKIY